MREVTVILKCDNCGRSDDTDDDETNIQTDVAFQFGPGPVVYVDICSTCYHIIEQYHEHMVANAHDKPFDAPVKPSKKASTPRDTPCPICGVKTTKRGWNMHIAKMHPADYDPPQGTR